MKLGVLGKRLLCASNFVRQDAYLADIGTDHAYLPLFLLDAGRIVGAVCSDINSAPLESAKRNAALYGHAEKIKFVLADGAGALADMGITDYTVCGMGGELIADIIERAPQLKSGDVRLILQPMTKHAHLRRYLAAAGFSVLAEAYSKDAGKFYVTVVAEYDGRQREISNLEAELGKIEKNKISAEQAGFIKARVASLKRAALGKGAGGDDSYEASVLREYEKVVGEIEV
ncbi:MAG: SAM-dependent methyltransferase [Clostridia bacterium]|nr:SAM-dependent methyltransferase [Clostridia bacterium]